MSIIIITGTPGSGKTTVANALRNNQISNKHGALLVDESNDGDPVPLLEKILVGVPLRPGVPAEEQPWKPNSAVILIGAKMAILDTFEMLAPGFKKLHGPVYTIETRRA